MSCEQATISAELITRHHRYSGSIEAGGRRLADVLADTSLNILEVQQVLVTARGARSMEIRCGQMLIRKEDVLIAIPRGCYEAPVRRRNNYRKKNRYGAMVVISGYTLTGIIYLPPRTKSWALIDHNSNLPSFFGLTDVTVHGSPHDLVPPQCDTAIVQRHAIEAMQLSAQPLPQPEADQGQQQQPAP